MTSSFSHSPGVSLQISWFDTCSFAYLDMIPFCFRRAWTLASSSGGRDDGRGMRLGLRRCSISSSLARCRIRRSSRPGAQAGGLGLHIEGLVINTFSEETDTYVVHTFRANSSCSASHLGFFSFRVNNEHNREWAQYIHQSLVLSFGVSAFGLHPTWILLAGHAWKLRD